MKKEKQSGKVYYQQTEEELDKAEEKDQGELKEQLAFLAEDLERFEKERFIVPQETIDFYQTLTEKIYLPMEDFVLKSNANTSSLAKIIMDYVDGTITLEEMIEKADMVMRMTYLE